MLSVLPQAGDGGIRRANLRDLTERVRAIENRPLGEARDAGFVATGWDEHGASAGRLARGVVHEWFGPVDGEWSFGPPMSRGGRGIARNETDDRWAGPVWSPPLCILAHLARRALSGEDGGGWAVWIGRSCWPYPRVLSGGFNGDPSLLRRSVFADPPDDAGRVWAIELALRCRAVAAVLADGSRLDMAGSRRLQLAAKAGRALCLVARPVEEGKELSAAATRWLVRRLPGAGDAEEGSGAGARWTVELLRCKGVQPATGTLRPVIVEWDHAQGSVCVPAHVVRRAGETADQRERGGGRRTA